MKDAAFFNSIYKDIDSYIGIADSVMGRGHFLSSEIVSDCITKILLRHKAGKLDLEDITYNDGVNKSYMTRVIKNACMSYLKSKKVRMIC